MAEKVLPPPSEQSRPWPCAGPREVHLPENPSYVDVTSKTAVHWDFADVWYYSLKVWLHWTEGGHPYTLTFSITGCTKLIMVANPILSGAL